MQLHELRPTIESKKRKRVGRGGKRGTFSGRGSKGQKSRAGHRIRPGFRGGDNPLWKLFPKQRGAGKKIDVKHTFFSVRQTKPVAINLNDLTREFKDGEKITPRKLVRKNIVKTAKKGIKILGGGALNKKLNLSGIKVSKTAKERIIEAGGTVE